MTTIWERAAHSINRMFSLLCLFGALVLFQFGFECRFLVLNTSDPGHCLPLTFFDQIAICFLIYQSSKLSSLETDISLIMGHFGTNSCMQPHIMIKCLGNSDKI